MSVKYIGHLNGGHFRQTYGVQALDTSVAKSLKKIYKDKTNIDTHFCEKDTAIVTARLQVHDVGLE